MFSPSTLIGKMRGEYESSPGLKLTCEQACHLWAVDANTCNAAIDALVEEGFLHGTGTGKYIALPSPNGTAVKASNSAVRISPVRCPHCQKLNTMERESGAETLIAGRSFRCVACGRIVSFTAISA